MKRFKRIALFVALVASVALISACGNKAEEEAQATAAAETATAQVQAAATAQAGTATAVAGSQATVLAQAVMATLTAEALATPTPDTSVESVARSAFDAWAVSNGEPYRDVQVLAEDNDGFFAHLRVLAWFRPDASRPWEERDAPLECRKVGESWQCDEWLEFRLTQGEEQRRANIRATADAQAAATAAVEATSTAVVVHATATAATQATTTAITKVTSTAVAVVTAAAVGTSAAVARATATAVALAACYSEAESLSQATKYREAAARFEQCGPYRDAPHREYQAHLDAYRAFLAADQIQEANEEENWLYGRWDNLHTLNFIDFVWSPSGQMIAGIWDDEVHLLTVNDGQFLDMLLGEQYRSWGLHWSPDEQMLASISGGSVHIWRVSDGQHLQHINVSGGVSTIAWSPDNMTLATGSLESWDSNIRLWRASDGQLLRTLVGHTDRIDSFVWSHDGRTLASASIDYTIRFWRVADGGLLQTLEMGTVIWDMVGSPDGRLLAAGLGDNTIKVWQMEDGRLLHTLRGHTGGVYRVAWSPDGQLLASVSPYDKTIRVWRVQDGQLLHSLDEYAATIRSVAWSPDGQLLAFGSDDNTVRIWRARDGRLLRTFEGHAYSVWNVVWSPDGQLLASMSKDGKVMVWGYK